ncbi:MAG: DAK2 domain-containing protein [Acholeplasmatales bacterium]|nr:DAK2 domain-containing protein [Acholeplasmatales bacterium]
MKELNGFLYKRMLENGLALLANDENRINALNVFPVPDGDTGTNMRLTLEGGINNMPEDESLSAAAKGLSRGMLLGARGNSGVILSQLFKGQYLYFKDKECVDAFGFAEALEQGYKTAYNAVIHPAEGTILTVAREGIHLIKSYINYSTSLRELLIALIKQMELSLANTPNLLPVLKDAGVIDSGGAGLVLIYKGMLKYLDNEIVKRNDVVVVKASAATSKNRFDFDENSDLIYGYCTEFILQLQTKKVDVNNFDINQFIHYLESKGDSVVCFKDDTRVKVHVHTFTPGDILNEAQKYGEFISLKIDNMSIQNNEMKNEEKKKNIVTIAVANGSGVINEFKSFGCDVVINGGDKFNTSSQEFIMAIKANPADDYIIFPNNKNIILAAKQAKEILGNDNIHIIETKSVAECYFGLQMTALDDTDIKIDEHLENIKEGIDGVNTLLITRAIRKSFVDGIEINGGDYMAILDGKIIKTSLNRDDLVLEALKLVPEIDEKAIISIFTGKNISEEEIEELNNKINEDYDYIETGIIDGKQDIYDFIIGIN